MPPAVGCALPTNCCLAYLQRAGQAAVAVEKGCKATTNNLADLQQHSRTATGVSTLQGQFATRELFLVEAAGRQRPLDELNYHVFGNCLQTTPQTGPPASFVN
jgi:hypothetical protein